MLLHPHFRRSRRAMRALLAGLAAIAWGVGVAGAMGPFPPPKRTPVLDAALPGTPAVGHVTGTRVAFAPGQPTPPHLHPVPVIGAVTVGSFVFQPEGEPSRILHTGDAFYEPANARIARFDNASATQPAGITAFSLSPNGPGSP